MTALESLGKRLTRLRAPIEYGLDGTDVALSRFIVMLICMLSQNRKDEIVDTKSAWPSQFLNH